MAGDINDLIYRLKDLQEKTSDMSPVMKKIAGAMRTKVQMGFKEQKDPEGNPWKKSKRAEKDGGMTLSDTRELKASLNNMRYGPTFASVGTNLPYARVLHFGATKGSFGTHRVTQKVKPFDRVRLGKQEHVRAHSRNRNILSPWGDIPSRKFIGMTTADKEKYLKMIAEYLEKD